MLAPDRAVTRTVQGVELRMPWSHRLPDYAAATPAYGQNIVRLAELLAVPDAPLRMLDVGANIGDTALQVLERVDARVLCVEGDPYWLRWLVANTGTHPHVTVVPGLLQVGPDTPATTPRRRSGTTRFVSGDADGSAGTLSVEELQRRHPELERVRLVKSDTDGYDVVLVPGLAAGRADRRPVLFFEYDLGLSLAAGNDPGRVWPELADLGYDAVSVWDNLGEPVAALDVATLAAEPDIAVLTGDSAPYWDVAVAHGEDVEGTAAVRTCLEAARP
jgi:FkbM family methyltransferase